MDIRTVSKAVAGAVATGALGVAAAPQLIPDGVDAPWWGHLLAGLVSAAIGFAVVYIAPANVTKR